MKKDSVQQIKTRLVLNFPGFEPTDSVAQLGRLEYAANNTGKVWHFKTTQSPIQQIEGQNHIVVNHETIGANWKSDTKIVQFRWNDIVHEYEKATFPFGFLKDSAKYLSFFLDGTIYKYFKASPRYWGFTIFPILLLAIFAIVSWFGIQTLASSFMSQNFGLHILETLISTLILCKLFGKLTYLTTTIADWGFARDMVNQKNSAIEQRFEEFAKTAAKHIKASKQDEIIIVGHSFGALWALAALGKALEKEPELLNNKKVTFLALGSSILKIALAPNAHYMRNYWNQIVKQKNLFWHEIQTKNDWIAFYKSNPFEVSNTQEPMGGLAIERIKFKDGMDRKRYKKMSRSFYTTHRQYILYYDKRVHFDYMLRLFGPFGAKALAQDKELHLHIDQSGKLV
ncbi:MAG: hypothetical protein AB8B49_01270 [Nitratireductor sp.]